MKKLLLALTAIAALSTSALIAADAKEDKKCCEGKDQKCCKDAPAGDQAKPCCPAEKKS